MKLGAALLTLATAALLAGGFAAVSSAGSGPDSSHPVVVGDERVSIVELEGGAWRATGGDALRLADERRRTAARKIELLWLEGEAVRLGLPAHGGASVLRGRVADALAGKVARDRDAFAGAFTAFHARWRAKTQCLAAYDDPVTGRCGNQPQAAARSCLWMGEATVCQSAARRRAWTVVAAGKRLRVRGERRAIAAAMKRYAAARAKRARRAQAAAAADARARRLADPALSAHTVEAAAPACERFAAEIEPYLFGAGMQDLRGQAEGFLAARENAARSLADAAADQVDTGKLRPLVRALDDGNESLRTMDAAAAAGAWDAAYAELRRYEAHQAAESRIADRIGLPGCVTAAAADDPA